MFPSSCLLCGARSGSTPVCSACENDLPVFPARRCCPRCGDSSPLGNECGICLRHPPSFDRTHAVWCYAFPADKLIQALKYSHRLPLARWFGEQLGGPLANTPIDRILPLPLHPQRLGKRGFNQSLEIAQTLANCLNVPVDRNSLQRVRATPPQAALPFKQRQKNVRGAFECRNDFSGQRLLIIDDVMTTGATLAEAARILKLHGAAWVGLGVMARALRDDIPEQAERKTEAIRG